MDDKKQLREKYNIPHGKKVILFSAANSKDINKGYGYVIETVKKLTDENVFFVEVGGVDAKTTSNFKSLGFISDEKSLAEIYNLADVFLYTSLIETLPLTVMESMACGLPVVAFNVWGVSETVNKECGFLVEPKNPEQLAEKILYLFSNRDIKNAIINNNIEKSKYYSIDSIVKKLLLMYQSCIKKT